MSRALTRTWSDAISSFAGEVGTPAAGPVVAVGGHTQFDIGGPVDPAARRVRAPAGVVEHVPADMTVRVLAGTTVADLDAALAPAAQCVALPAAAGSTVGGVLAVGRSGLRQLGWGPVRDTLLEATVVTADGTVAVAGGPTVKNVSGFDLCRLVVGSLGTLALVAEVVLRTRPIPAAEQWLAGVAHPSVVSGALYRPVSILWDGETTWVLLVGHPEDVAAQAALAGEHGLEPVVGPPTLPPHRWSMDPTLSSLADAPPWRTADAGWVAQWGVGVVHHPEPPPVRALDPAVEELHRRLKANFDPTGRLAPGRAIGAR